MRIRLEYFDQNDEFAGILPRVGIAERRVEIAGLGSDWTLLSLDKPFDYQSREHRQLLIRSRWDGYAVGEPEPTSVFILLGRNTGSLDKPLLSEQDVDHVAWGMAHTVA